MRLLDYLLRTGFKTLKVDHIAENLSIEFDQSWIKRGDTCVAKYIIAEKQLKKEQEQREKRKAGFCYFDKFYPWD